MTQHVQPLWRQSVLQGVLSQSIYLWAFGVRRSIFDKVVPFKGFVLLFFVFFRPKTRKVCPKSDLSTEGGPSPPLAGPPWGKFCGFWVEKTQNKHAVIYLITYQENRRKKYEILPADRTVAQEPCTKGGDATLQSPFCAGFRANSSVCRQNLIFFASIFQAIK